MDAEHDSEQVATASVSLQRFRGLPQALIGEHQAPIKLFGEVVELQSPLVQAHGAVAFALIFEVLAKCHKIAQKSSAQALPDAEHPDRFPLAF